MSKKKANPKVLDLHVLIEHKSESIRAHCLEFDLIVSGKNTEQAMVRMEKAVKVHLGYACEHKSNPVHFADQAAHDKWFDRSPSPVKKSWILEVRQANKKPSGQRKGSSAMSPVFKSYEQPTFDEFGQLACA